MSKSKPELNGWLGTRFYKENEDGTFTIIKMIRISEFNDKITIMDMETRQTKEVPYTMLKEGYTPLIPRGKILITSVGIVDPDSGDLNKDVIIAGYDSEQQEKMKVALPFCICRQSVRDFFYDMKDPNHNYVGVSVNVSNVPVGITIQQLLAADKMYESAIVNFYMDDDVESILEAVDTTPFDKVLRKLFIDHMKSLNPIMFNEKNLTKTEDKGWCSSLKELLTLNNFDTDLDEMRNITAVDFDLSEHLIEDEGEYGEHIQVLNEEALLFFSLTFEVPVKRTYVLQWGMDIDPGDFKQTTYRLISDSKGILWIVVFMAEGEFLEAELQKKADTLGVSQRLRLAFWNKYANS